MKRLEWRGKRFARTVIGVAVASCFVVSPALANPTGHTVVNGTASVIQNGNLLQITNSPNAIINWQSFSIGANEITRFIQQSAASAVLNRVGAGASPSQILGTLQSTLANGTIAGRVFLINPNGITFGAGAQIDVGGLVASTLNMTDADFLAGRMRFGDGLGKTLLNEGNITTTAGGNVYLVGPAVTNKGIITSPNGEVILVAGNSVELVNPGTPNLRVEISASENEARNLGQIIADSGRVGIYAGLINHSGTIRADSAVATEDGRIVLKATKNTTLEAGSVTTANGPRGGSVTVQSGDTTLVAGTVEAKGLGSPPSEGGVAPAGDGVVGKGGTVQILGNLVGLIDNASINVSGETGGGAVLVGGDFQGKNPDIQNAFRTYFGPNATIKADAVTSGDGGKVIVWSDDTTRFYGEISARGGANGGNGGFAEVSGKEFLVYRGTADLRAPAGRFGTLLLDPRDITIQASGADDAQLSINVPTPLDPAGSIYFADVDGTTDFTLTAVTVSASTANVVLQAQRDVSIDAPVNISALGVGFTAQAGRDINVNQSLTTNGGRIHLEADSPHSGSFFDGVGVVKINAPVNSCGGLSLAACPVNSGGAITLIGGGNSSPQGGFILYADVVAGYKDINVALSDAPTNTLNFFIGAGGNTQLSSNDTGSLKTRGALVLGSATTAGTDGLGTGAISLTVNSITNATATPIQLSADSGSSFQLIAGPGGVLLDKPLTTYQDTVINTSGTLSINNTLATSNNDLTVTASNVNVTGSVNIGSGGCSFNGGSCPFVSNQVFWDGGSLTSPLDWFDPANWSGDFVPTSSHDVTIGTGFGTIQIAQIAGTAQAKSLIANSPLQLSTGSLTLANASNLSDAFTLSGGTVQGTGGLTLSSPNGVFTWSGGAMASGGTFLLATGRSGTLSNALTLNRLFENQGSLTLSGATIGGTGSITNLGTLTATGTNVVSKMLLSLGTVDGSGSLTVNDWSRTGGVFNMAGTADLRVPSGNFSVDQTYSAGNLTLQAPAGDIVLNAAVTGTGSSGTTVTLVAGNNFTNIITNAINPGSGRFLVYSTNPANDTRGGLVYDFKQYDATFGVTTVQGTGNGFLYSVAPSITPSLTGTATRQYDGSTTAPTGSLAVSAGTGVIDSDTVTLAFAGATYDNSNVNTFKQVSANGISIVESNNGGKPVYGYQFSSTTASNNIGTINKADLTISTNNVTKTYDGTLGMTGATGQGAVVTSGTLYNNVSNGNTQDSLSGGTFAYTNANAGTGNKTVTVAGVTVNDGNLGGNYNVTLAGNTTSTINPAVISLAGSRIYDGTMDFATGTFGTINGVAGETLTVTGSGTVASKNVGTQTLTGLPALADGTGLASNYTLTSGTHTGTITQRAITVTAQTDTKVYDVTTSSAGTPVIAGGLGAGDTGGFIQSFDTKNVGSGKTLTASGAVSDGNGGANYLVSFVADATGVITPASLTGSITADNKVYDGTTAATISSRRLAGAIGGDSVSYTGGTATFDTKNVGTGKTVTATGLGLAGADAANYTVNGTAPTTAAITARPITITASTDTKVYDTTTGSAVSPSITSGTLAGGDTVGFIQSFDTKNAGTGKTLTASGAVSDGNGGNNYAVTFVGDNTGVISPASLALSGVTVNNKVYDATTVATLSTGSAALSGVLGSDTVTVNSAAATGAFADKNVGTAKPVSGGGVTISGADAGNYTLMQPTGLTADITAATLTVNGVTANSKVYDATTGATFNTGSAALGGVFGGDTVTLNSASASGAFADKNVGTAKPVTASAFSISGAHAGNYALTQPTGLTASVTPATLTYVANTASRERGDPNPAFSGTVTGFVGGESLATATTGPPSFTSPTTQSSLEGQYAIGGGGVTANYGNYAFVQAPANATALTIAAPVNFLWTAGSGGTWEAGSNWNKGFAPVDGAVVTIPDIGMPGVSETITYSSGITNVKTVTSSEALTIAGGTLNLGSTLADVSTLPMVNLAGGMLGGAGTLNVATLNVLAGGVLGGSGTINGNVTNAAGVVAPGASAGTLTINGNYVQGSTGVLAVEIGGTTPGAYDQLMVSGNATLDGTLNVLLVNGFTPAGGDTFTVLQAGGSLSGTFAATNFPALPPMSANYLASSFSVLTAGSAAPPLAVEQSTQTVVAAVDQSVVSPMATETQESGTSAEKEEKKKKKLPICTGRSSGGGGSGGGGGGPTISGGGGYGGRCTTRGCF